MESQVQAVVDEALARLSATPNTAALEAWRVEYLGKSGKLTQLVRSIGKLPREERAAAGKVVNQARRLLTEQFEARRKQLLESERRAELARRRVDPTLPGVDFPLGGLHPIATTLDELRAIFLSVGFAEARGPEVESEAYNFELLNIPADHPARDMWDTFYTHGGRVLRTHTSPVQIRVMREMAGQPLKVICPGRVYRYEQVTARTEFMFHQVEGLEVGPNVTMSVLIGVLRTFAQRVFGARRRIRVRSSYFPFTEPSIEVDVDCFLCGAHGCSVCKGTGWVEILGAGMVHPVVLRNGGYDPNEVTGYAFGLGVERIAMLKHGIDDIRHFYRNDLRFLRQFHRI